MKKLKIVVLFLFATVLLTSCGQGAKVTVRDGKQTFVFYAQEECSVEDVLRELGIELAEGDELSIPLDEVISGPTSLDILRRCVITIVTPEGERQIVIVGGTVQDALQSAGIALEEGQFLNYDTNDYLENGMRILLISEEEMKALMAETETETETEEEKEQQASRGNQGNNNNNYNNNSNSNNNNNNNSSSSSNTPAPAPTEPEPTTEAPVTVVSVEDYPNLDDPEHGYRVIIYSNGDVEIVEY